MSARWPRRALAVAAAVAVAALATAAAVGWQYLLREAHGLAGGPAISGALPLQRLAHQDTQPLLRVLLAWIPAGVGAGLVLARLTPLPRAARVLIATATTFVVLFLAGAGADAVTANERIGPHVASQLGHAALWLATATMAAGAAVAAGASRGRAS
jgi:hypothetical protein